MNEHTKNQCGSPSRDLFKLNHKTKLPKHCYATDADLILVDKNPERIVAVLDYKRSNDGVTFTEAIFYNLILMVTKVFVIYGDNPDCGPFTVRQLNSADYKPNPPACVFGESLLLPDWSALGRWEESLRANSRREIADLEKRYSKTNTLSAARVTPAVEPTPAQEFQKAPAPSEITL